ncbi:MAG: sugar-binding transcriptional regulator [Thermomicrobiales bacterium]
MPDAERALLATIARMYYLDGLGQSEIADIVGVSRSTVSRQLTAARERGIVRIAVDDVDPRHTDLEHALQQRFGLRRVVVVRGLEGSAANARKAVAYFSASIVGSWIAHAATIGVAGGRTLGLMTQFMEPHPIPAVATPEIVQLMGTVGPAPSNVDASEIARALARRLHGSIQTINAPAYMDDSQSRDLLLAHRQIRTVRDTFAHLDVALIGIGTPIDSLFADRQSFSPHDHVALQEAGAVGEICGRFFDARGRECDSPYRDRVIGVDLATLRQAGEVIAITAGVSKQAAVTAALRGGLVHSLVIDEAGAAVILNGLHATRARRQPTPRSPSV